ncbi:MAG: class I SAM-dependent methyltransferase [Selenomonas sp.]|nr:class I SAM-dependent methyltransferase [Selenomonas sp.]
MEREKCREKVWQAYRGVGQFAAAYDGMMANSSLLGRLAMRWVWGISDEGYRRFLRQAFAGIPKGFAGRMLEIPVGTGVLSLPVYRSLPQADILCMDYSETMLAAARQRADGMGLANVSFLQGDVGQLPSPEGQFDLVLSLNGFHVFPDKPRAYLETRRVLKGGGIFCGCMYVRGESRGRDFFVQNFCERKGYFSPPYETKESLEKRLREGYEEVSISLVGSFAGFVCKK